MFKSASVGIMILLGLIAAPLRAAPGDLEIARLRGEVANAIAGWLSEPAPEDQAIWRAEAEAMLARWTAFRDARCDSVLIAYERRGNGATREASQSCRAAFDRLIVSDLRYRYAIQPEGERRPSLDPETDARPFYPEDPEAMDCEPPPEPECDYCAANACWEQKLREDDAQLDALWRRVLGSIAQRGDLTDGRRADWTERLRRTQQAWLVLRDADCELQQWETPNRFGRANYSMIEAPCRHAETRARMQRLAEVYLDEATAVAATIPDRYRGLWAADGSACPSTTETTTDRSDMLVTVSARQIEHFASIATVRTARPTRDGFVFEVDGEEEGERFRAEMHLRLDGDRLSIRSESGDSQSYVRCPGAS